MLKSLTLLRERIADPLVYPFSVPAIASLTQLTFPSRVTFFTGENSSGKSTLLEAIAAHIGFGREGGNRDMRFQTSESSSAIEPLASSLRLGFVPYRSGEGFYFRAESLFSVAEQIDEWDEPEAALSPQRQLAFLVLIHDTLRDYKDAQFIISTHSPILLGYPGAQILSFDGGVVHEIPYEETSPLQIVSRFTTDRRQFLRELFNDPPSLFDDEDLD